MRLVLLVLVAGLAIGFALGGSIRNLGELKLRYWGLAFLGYALQVVPYPESWGASIPIAGLLVSFILLLFFALANLSQPGVVVIAAGILMNFTVISANWGMPVSGEALIASGQEEVLEELTLEPGQKHHLATSEDHVRFLGDVIPIPPPIHLAASIGDLTMYAGVAALIAVRMKRRDPGLPDRPPTAAASSG